jgi:hypothetical protein
LIFSFPPIPYSLLIYGCLLIGFVGGWVAHLLKSRRSERQAPASAPASSPDSS